MGLREKARADLNKIVRNRSTGFGWDMLLTNPAGVQEAFVGFNADIGQVIDPETGMYMSGRLGSIAVTIAELNEKGFDLPRAIADEMSKPWIVDLDDLEGESYTFKVSRSMPDRSAGLVVCILEAYE